MKRNGGVGLGRKSSWSVLQATEGPVNLAGSPGMSDAHLQWKPAYLQICLPQSPDVDCTGRAMASGRADI